jgi:hypothetical protein
MKILFPLLFAGSLFAQGVGVNAHGIDLTQNAAVTNGGYFRFAPISYNPHDGGSCLDVWGNLTQQPMPTGNLASSFGANDLFLWNSLSPSVPMSSGSTTPSGLVQKVYYNDSSANGPCGVPLIVNLNYGLNTNGYFFARGGLATDQTYFNSIQSLQGGVIAGSYTAGIYYPASTVVCTVYNGSSCTSTSTLSVGAYLGGHMDTGHSSGPPASGGIGAVSNPFTGGEGLVAGMIYYDDALGCERVYSGSAWSCLASGAGAVSSFNTRTGAVTLTKADVTAVDQALGTGDAPTFASITAVTHNCTATSTTACVQQSSGTFTITGAGNAAFQTVSATSTFNSLATGSTAAFQQSSGTFVITGAGNASFQSVAVTNGLSGSSLTVGGFYGINGSGAGTLSSLSVGGLSSSGTLSGNVISASGTITAFGTLYAQNNLSVTGVASTSVGIIDGGYLTVAGAIVVAGNTGVSGSSCTVFTNGVCTHL